MKLYHGGIEEIIEIDLKKTKLYKDFGKGFYATNIREQAEIWAELQAEIQSKKNKNYKQKGFVSCYNFIESAFSDDDYKVLRFSGYTEEWFDFVVSNRDKNTIFTHEFDIVDGPVADDKIVLEIDSYLRNPTTKAKEKFLKELSKYPIPSHQICFCTTNALRSIERVDLKPLTRIERISVVVGTDLVVKHNFSLEKAIDTFAASKTFANLFDENTKLYDEPASKICNMLKIELGLIKIPQQSS